MGLKQILGWLIVTTAIYSAFMILILHLLQPEFNPLMNAISEFVFGKYGYLMTTVFYAQGLGSICVGIIAWKIDFRKKRAKVSSVFFVVSALGAFIAGLYDADPISQTELTKAGMIHAAGGLMRFLSLCLAVPLLSSVVKGHHHWKNRNKPLRLLSALYIIGFIGSIMILAPSNLFGLGQRFFISILLLWMVFFSLPLIKDRQTKD